MITAITCSSDLAEILNSQPAEADAADTPRNWLDGIWVAGTVYPLSPEETTDTLAALANGTAAVKFSPFGERCGGEHHRTAVESEAGHWCPADVEWWTSDDDDRGVERDWRQVRVWDANGYCETTVYPTLLAAKAAFEREVAALCID